jgi:DNA polymerase-1
MNKLFLLDAYALIFRAHYAFMKQPMRNSAGMVTSPIFGFTKFLREIIIRERPRHLGVAFDPKGGNFRHQLYPLYKANRTETPEDIITAVPWIKRILDAMCIPVVEVAGWEADDVIGTLSVKASAAGYETCMVTPDKDFGQLVTPSAVIYKQRKNDDDVEIVDVAAIRAKYGIDEPRQVIDILALWGDASDNVPGVPGIGEKGAAKLVGQFGSVENILDIAERGGKELTPRVRDSLLTNRDQLMLAKQLVTIDTTAPVDFVAESLEMCDPDVDTLRTIYTELGFRSFLREMDSDHRSPFNSAAMCREGVAPMPAAELVTNNAKGVPQLTPLLQEGGVDGETPDGVVGLFQSAPTPTSPRALAQQPPPRPDGQGDLFAPPASLESVPPALDLFSSAPALASIATVEHKYTTVDSDDALRELVATLSTGSRFAYDTETTGYDCFTNRLVGVSLCAEPHRAFWVPVSADPAESAARLAILKPLFENEKIDKIGQNIKFDDEFLRSAGIEPRGRKFDTMLLHYLLDPESRHGMDHLARTYLDYDPIPISALIGSGARAITMDMVSPDRVAEYAAEDADVTLRLFDALWPRIVEQGLEKLYFDVEEPLIDVLAAMEREGVRIDTGALADYAGELATQLAGLELRIRELTGVPDLNVNSARQLGEVLFARMKLVEKPRMTKTRQYATDEETLQGIADRHPVVGMILDYRGVKKLLSTYVEALPQLVNRVTRRIHTSYNQAVTATGRLSSTNPNLQNIPIRDEQGRAIRRAFVPSDGDHVLLSADYSQVELRIMAHLSGDEAMVDAFRRGEDIHRDTAARIFGVSPENVTSDQRRKAKTANFGIIYGISAFGLSQRLSIPRSEASEIIAGYFRSYPGVHNYMERVAAEARERGYVETIFGRRRYLADIGSANATMRAFAERNAINAPIQGSAADIMKLAMIRIFRGLNERGLRSRMILQVHDEVVIDTLRGEVDAVSTLVREAMEGAASLAVPLIAEVGIGENWLTAH